MVDSLHSVCFWIPDVAFGYDLGLAAKASSRFSHGYATVQCGGLGGKETVVRQV
jgi:hypothetical protein